MNLIRAILLLIFLITPLKANTIYNLIKIPNLEIYEINTKNKLRYFYAARPFQLGTQKNIVCSNPNKKDLELKYKIILKNLNRYSYDYLKKINLKYIVMCENLSISELYTAGIPDNIMKTLILDIKFNEKYLVRRTPTWSACSKVWRESWFPVSSSAFLLRGGRRFSSVTNEVKFRKSLSRTSAAPRFGRAMLIH